MQSKLTLSMWWIGSGVRVEGWGGVGLKSLTFGIQVEHQS